MVLRQDGDRPRGVHTRAGGTAAVPIGIEKVLCRAAADSAFRQTLMEHRERALADGADDLSPTERTTLLAIPDRTLATMIDRIDLKRHPRRRFMKAVVSAALFTAASTAPVACFLPACTGIAPDEDFVPAVVDVKDDEDKTGDEPDTELTDIRQAQDAQTGTPDSESDAKGATEQ